MSEMLQNLFHLMRRKMIQPHAPSENVTELHQCLKLLGSPKRFHYHIYLNPIYIFLKVYDGECNCCEVKYLDKMVKPGHTWCENEKLHGKVFFSITSTLINA